MSTENTTGGNVNITEAQVRQFIAEHRAILADTYKARIMANCYASPIFPEGQWIVSDDGTGTLGSGDSLAEAVDAFAERHKSAEERAAALRKRAEALLAEAAQIEREAA